MIVINQNKPENKKGHKIQGIDIKSHKVIDEFQSINEAIKFLNVNLHKDTLRKNINECLKGNRESYKKFIWQYSVPYILPGEIWASIHPKLIGECKNYQISTKCRIQLYDGTITYGSKNSKDYMIIIINGTNFHVHRLVAHIFIHNDENLKNLNKQL